MRLLCPLRQTFFPAAGWLIWGGYVAAAGKKGRAGSQPHDQPILRPARLAYPSL